MGNFNRGGAALNFISYGINYFLAAHGVSVDSGFPFYYIFEVLIGVYIYFNRKKIICKFSKWYICLGLLALCVTIVAIYTYSDNNYVKVLSYNHCTLLGLVVPFLTIITGYTFGKIRIKYDFTFGIYLFHMIAFGIVNNMGFSGVVEILLTAIVTAALAVLEYFIVENHKWIRKIMNYKRNENE